MKKIEPSGSLNFSKIDDASDDSGSPTAWLNMNVL